jgi:hypothetical protein
MFGSVRGIDRWMSDKDNKRVSCCLKRMRIYSNFLFAFYLPNRNIRVMNPRCISPFPQNLIIL